MALALVNTSEVRERLKVQLVSTVGPFGTKRGCPLAQTKKEFLKDWNESLEDYASRLGFKPTDDGVLKMIADLSDVVRVDSTNGETTVYAVNNQKLSHCFWLIDNTRERRSSRGGARNKSRTKNKSHTSRNGRHRSEFDTICFNCWKIGHISRECRERRIEPTCFDRGDISRECSRSRSRLCYNCSKPGHISRNCPKKQRQLLQIADVRTSANVMNSASADPNVEWLQCENCYEIGHLSRECPKKQQHILKKERRSSRGGARKKSRSNRRGRHRTESGTICFNCWKIGHISRECRERRIEPTCFDRGDTGRFSRECSRSRSRLCYNCSEPGHIIRDCPKKKRQLLQISDATVSRISSKEYSQAERLGSNSEKNHIEVDDEYKVLKDLTIDFEKMCITFLNYLSMKCSKP